MKFYLSPKSIFFQLKDNFWIILIFISGVFFRVYRLDQQLLLDDEWHSIWHSNSYTMKWLFENFVPGATAIPLNLYNRFMLEYFHWSEIFLRVPNLLAGILVLPVFYYFINKLISKTIAFYFLALIAFSPFLIFYSRSSRPYSIFLLFTFSAVVSMYLLLRDGKNRYLWFFSITSFFATYFHLFALPASLTVLGYAYLLKLASGKNLLSLGNRIKVACSLKQLVNATLIYLIPVFIFYFNPIKNGMLNMLPKVTDFNLSAHLIYGLLELMSGTENKICIVLFLFLFFLSLKRILSSEQKILGTMIVLVFISYIIALYVSKPWLAESMPIVFLRYTVIFVPFYCMMVVIGADCLVGFAVKKINNKVLFKKNYLSTMCILFLSVYFFITPLPGLYRGQNNFMLHSAYHESYKKLNWDRAYVSQFHPVLEINIQNMPRFYKMLQKEHEKFSIIEYPLPVEDHYNILYYYQHFHQKKVIAGFFQGSYKERQMIPAKPLGHYLDGDIEKRRLRFKSFVEISDLQRIRGIGAKYIVIHKELMAEIQGKLPSGRFKHSVIMMEKYKQEFGDPIFEDQWIWVFLI